MKTPNHSLQADVPVGPRPELKRWASGEIGMSAEIESAAYRGDLEEIQKRISLGDDPNWVDKSGDSLLSVAISSWENPRKVETVRLLLELGTQPNQFPGVSSPCVDAIFSDDAEIVRLLLDNGLNPNEVVEGTESLYDLAKSDYLYEQYYAHGPFSTAEFRPVREDRTEDEWLEYLEESAKKHMKVPPSVCRVLRAHGARTLYELEAQTPNHSLQGRRP